MIAVSGFAQERPESPPVLCVRELVIVSDAPVASGQLVATHQRPPLLTGQKIRSHHSDGHRSIPAACPQAGAVPGVTDVMSAPDSAHRKY